MDTPCIRRWSCGSKIRHTVWHMREHEPMLKQLLGGEVLAFRKGFDYANGDVIKLAHGSVVQYNGDCKERS